LSSVEDKLACELSRVSVKRPSAPLVFNVSAEFARDSELIKSNLIRQVSSPILWEQSIRVLIESGIEQFIGIGPGNSLSRLMKRIAPELKTFSVEKTDDLECLPCS
jgi:[acyl-carrier-protein] S-malonyltransferase